jgi:hypothetical protein
MLVVLRTNVGFIIVRVATVTHGLSEIDYIYVVAAGD